MDGSSVPFEEGRGIVPLQDAGASAPSAAHIEPEPREWEPRVLWVGARQLAGAASFFFLAFVFAYFYLRSLDLNKSWKIGHVDPPIGIGVAIVVLLVVSAVLMRLAAMRPREAARPGGAALVLALAAVVLQFVEYVSLGFGAASGGYASVFIGWTALYAVFAVPCLYWIETQVATVWRAKREGIWENDGEVLRAGLEACSFFWAYYVAIGVVTFVILYVL
jgi:heme/copper-type cytochrome/quinol oxidase subunit 3